MLVWSDSLTRTESSREQSLDLNRNGGSKGAGRKGAIPHQQALSPPEVCESVRNWDKGGGVLGCGQGNSKTNGPIFQVFFFFF